MKLDVKGNQLAYQLSEFGDYQVRIYAHIPMFIGSDTAMLCTIHYGPDNMALAEGDVYIEDNQLMYRSLSEPIETKVITSLTNGETMLAVDGAYAYVASESTLSRINITTGDIVAIADCSVEAFCVRANMVLVRGKKQITLWHKTDLTPIKTFDFNTPIINIETLAPTLTESEYCIHAGKMVMQDTIRVSTIPLNEAPKFNHPDAPQGVTVKENSSIATNITYSRNTKLSDKEKVSGVKVYIRNLQEVQDLIAYKSGYFDKTSTTFRFVAGCQRPIEQDTVIYIELEAIDEWGASAISKQIKLTIKKNTVVTDIDLAPIYPATTNQKRIINGRLFIIYDGQYYDVLGNKITDIQ